MFRSVAKTLTQAFSRSIALTNGSASHETKKLLFSATPASTSFKPLELSSKQFSSMVEKRSIQDHKRRLLAEKYELRRRLYKAFCKDPDLPKEMLEKLRYKLAKLPRNSAFTRVRNRCIFTGRPRSVYKFCRMSRIVFRGLASQGLLMGIKKASW